MVDGMRSIHEVYEARLLIHCSHAVIYFSPLKSLLPSSKETYKVCRWMVRSDLLVKLANFPAKIVLESLSLANSNVAKGWIRI
jgi:hypothetical protein